MKYGLEYDEIKDFDFPFKVGEDESDLFTHSCSINNIPFTSTTTENYHYMWSCLRKQVLLETLPPIKDAVNDFSEAGKYYIVDGRFQIVDKLTYTQQLNDNWKYYMEERYAKSEKAHWGNIIDEKFINLVKQVKDPVEYKLEPNEEFSVKVLVKPDVLEYSTGHFVYTNEPNPTRSLEVLYKFQKYEDYPLSLKRIYADGYIY